MQTLTPLSRVLATAALSLATIRSPVDADDVHVQVPNGFQATLYADDDLAHDIYAMTIDSFGRVVVSGQGYVRILIDSDGNGRADSFKQYADGPATGAQGLYFDGRDLLCTGDAGLIRYRDADGDDRADGPPQTLLEIKAGREHNAHSITRGPDGWWYLLAGNGTGVTDKHATLESSPVSQPGAGALLRIAPDFSGSEIVADGYRNPYDFAFNRQGDIFVFDSDGERDISLPWYRPTRVFMALSGSHAGWIRSSWKRPHYFADMPPVTAEFGRGSPTGVVCYLHHQFPAKYHNALFLCDWTFGRVMACPLQAHESVWRTEPIDFMTGLDQFGFAPTDIEVGPDGSLYVCVGGRGTRGGVYRVRWTGRPRRLATDRKPLSGVAACLAAPQPLSSWARATWGPRIEDLGREAFVDASLDDQFSPEDRARAIEVLTERFGGMDVELAGQLAGADQPEVRARTAWSLGRTRSVKTGQILAALACNPEPRVARSALEALLTIRNEISMRDVLAAPLPWGKDRSRFVRQSTWQLLAQMDPTEYQRWLRLLPSHDKAANISLYFPLVRHDQPLRDVALRAGAASFVRVKEPRERLDAIRLMQLALGDMGAVGMTPVFAGYGRSVDLAPHQEHLDAVRRQLAPHYPSGDWLVDLELARLIGMLLLGTDDQERPHGWLDKILARITDTSHPSDDVHHLIVAALLADVRSDRQRWKTADALVNVELKIIFRGLALDNNWDNRIGEIYAALVARDAGLPHVVVAHDAFGHPGHIKFLKPLDASRLKPAVARLVERIAKDPQYRWNNEIIRLLGRADRTHYADLLRSQFDNLAVQDAILIELSQLADGQDRERLRRGVESTQLAVLTACLNALERLPACIEPDEQGLLVRSLRRLGGDRSEFPVRETVIRLLRRNTGNNFGFIYGQAGHSAQAEVVARWSNWLNETHPENGASPLQLNEFRTRLAAVAWSDGDKQRGRMLFQNRSCARCHGGPNSLGPDLRGVTRRFSR